jgi:Domain of unknown function (DUF6379)
LPKLQQLQNSDGDLPEGIRAILAHSGKPRSFLREESIRNVTRNGIAGYELGINLTSYRALPLSCIEGLLLKVDGKEVDSSRVTLNLNGYSHKIGELPALSHVWWFILDPATLFVPSKKPLAPGKHAVVATLITVEPYVTAGRFSFYHQASRTLSVQEA